MVPRKRKRQIPGAIVPDWPLVITLTTILLLATQPAMANSWPPMAVSLFSLPLFASILSFGAGLILIILCETWILHQRETISVRSALRLVTEANFLSTLAGFTMVLILTSLPFTGFLFLSRPGSNIFQLEHLVEKFFGVIVLGVVLSFFWVIGKSTNLFIKRFTKLKISHPLLWGGAWIILVFISLTLLVTVGHFVHTEGLLLSILKTLGAMGYLAIGFLLSVIVEGACLGWHLPEGQTLGKTILIMNIRSYAYIAIPITLFFLR